MELYSSARRASICCLALALLAVPAAVGEAKTPPNWKVSSTGSTAPHADGRHYDTFVGTSSHLGRFTGEGSHVLDPTTGYFEGVATYTAANGAQLFVTYQGYIVNVDFTSDYPFEFRAEVQIVGGTGRLAGATGGGVMTGAFTGVPGDLFFNVAGTLDVRP